MNLNHLFYIGTLQFIILQINNVISKIHEDEIHLNTNLHNYNEIYELIKFENNNYLPKNITVEFSWNMFKINDIDKEYCYYYNKKLMKVINYIKGNDNCIIEDLYENLFTRNNSNIINLFEMIDENLFKFYDYEYNPDRPINLSDEELNIWRDNTFSKMRIEKLIIPGKGSNRLYTRIDTRRMLIGEYFGDLRIISEDKSVDIRRIKLNIGLSPIDMIISNMDNELEYKDSIIIDIELRNNLIFNNIYSRFYILNEPNKDRCDIISDMNNKYDLITIKPGIVEYIKIKCLKNNFWNINKNIKIRTECFWNNNRRYFFEMNYLGHRRLRELERGISLYNYGTINKLIEDDYNFITIKKLKKRELKHWSENKNNILNLYLNYNKNKLIINYIYLKIDLLEISSDILNMENIDMIVKIKENKEYDYLDINFEDKDELKLRFDSLTWKNSLINLKLRIKYYEKNIMDNIMKYKDLKFLYNIKIPIKIELKINNMNINNYIKNDEFVSKKKILKKTFTFVFQIDINNEFIFMGNIIYNEDGINRLIIDENDEKINMKVVKINKKTRLKEYYNDVKVDLYMKSIDDENLNRENYLKFIGNKLLKKVNKSQELLNFNINKYINKQEIINKQLISANEGLLQDLPYILIVEDKIFQLSTLANCGKIQISKDNIDFGIIPINLSNNIYKKKIKLNIRKNLKICNEQDILLVFTISKKYKLKIIDVEPKIINNKEEDSNIYFYTINIYEFKTYDLIIEPDFNQPINIENRKMVDITTDLKIYTQQTIRIEKNMDIQDIIRYNNNLNLEIKSKSQLPFKKLFLIKTIKVKCIIRSLNVNMGSPQLRNVLQSDLMRSEIIKKNKLPIGLMLIELRNDEEFAIQYSFQYVGNSINELNIFDYMVENYATYVSYDINEIDWNINIEFLERDLFESFEDYLLFNFPFKNCYYKKIKLDIKTGMINIYNDIQDSNENNVLIKIIPIDLMDKIDIIKFSVDYLKLNIWKLIIGLEIKSTNIKIIINFLIYETGRIDWHLYMNNNLKENNKYSLLNFLPFLIIESEYKFRFNLIDLIDMEKVDKSIKISIVPWLEISNEIPRVGYLLPKEKRIIPILIHNQIITSSSVNSKLKEINCNYNMLFKGIIDTDNSFNSKYLNSDELFVRKLIENNQELRSENMGVKSYFPINWKIPNILNNIGIGGGFVKKITLINSLSNKFNDMNSTYNSVIFVVEIQNPIICTKKHETSKFYNDEELDDLNDNNSNKISVQSSNRVCPPFNNLDLVKGFRIIWYPYNNFTPTNYKSIELLLKDIPKYNFKTSSYYFETSEDTENEENNMINRIFQDYLKENNSQDSDFAYLIKINCNCIINQQYSFKFAVTHHEDIQNSVFIPTFGFNVTIQDHSLRWLRSLKSLDDKNFQKIYHNFTQKICAGKINIFSNNTANLYWNKENLLSIDILSLKYIFNYKESSHTSENEWEMSELDINYNFRDEENVNLKKILLIDGSESINGIFKFFEQENNYNFLKYFIRIENLPSNSNIKFLVEIKNNNNEKFQCISKSFNTFNGVPTEPLNFQYSPLTSNSIKMSWDKPLTNGGSEIIDYKIKLIPELINNTSEYYFENIEKNINKTFIVIDNIPSIMSFRAEIQARNEFGLGSISRLNYVTPRNVICNNAKQYKLIIDEFSKRKLIWKMDQRYKKDLNYIHFYIYCNKKIEKNDNYLLVSLVQAERICEFFRNEIICNWIEIDKNIYNLKCDSYYIKVIEKNIYQSKSYNCLFDLNQSIIRRLNIYSEFGNENLLNRQINIRHLKSLEEISGLNISKNNIYYPRNYNPGWNNGLIKSILNLNLLNKNTTFIEVEINYLYILNHNIDILFNGTIEKVWLEKYLYDLKITNYEKGSKFMNTWSFDLENSNSLNKQIKEVELVILNLIPETNVLLSIKELDIFKNENSMTNHIFKIPKILRKIDLKNRKLLSSNFLQVNSERYLTDHIRDHDIGNNLEYNYLHKNLRYLKNEKINEYLKLTMKTNTNLFQKYLSNSLFVSGRIDIENWPNDFERRLFGDIKIFINSGHLTFENNKNQINDTVLNYKPISELQYYDQSFLKNEISNLFDGNLDTTLDFYKHEFQNIKINENSYFPHINIKLDPPICILYIKLHWKTIYSPISTIVSISVKSKNVLKPRSRLFNPTLHECVLNKSNGFNEDRIDTIPIIPPEEMVNTYFTNPLNRYPNIYNITLSFVGSCNDQKSENLILSLKEIELVPCITNDLIFSYSDPLSQKNNSLIRNDYYIKKHQLESKFSTIRQSIISNLIKELKTNTESEHALIQKDKLHNIISKYEIPINETKIHLDLRTVLSEENYIRSIQIPAVRLLIQDQNRSESKFPYNRRKLIQKKTVYHFDQNLKLIIKLLPEIFVLLKSNYIIVRKLLLKF